MTALPLSLDELTKKVRTLKQSGNFDLSLEEDLSIAVMNLISLEEHFFFTSQKIGKNDYLSLLSKTREIRTQLMSRMIDRHEGETWCISKHLLAASMRIMEVATKLQTAKNIKESETMFKTAYEVYSLFWALRLKLIDLKNVHHSPVPKGPWSYEDIVSKLVDCCKE